MLSGRFVQGLCERLDGLALLVGQMSRNDDVDCDKQVPGRRTACDSLALYAKGPALARPGRYLQGDRPTERRHRDGASERRLGVGDRDGESEVPTLPAEEGVGLHVHGHEEVTGRTAVAPGFAATFHADALAVFDTGRDPHLDLSLALLEAGAMAGGTRIDDLGPTAATLRARRGQREHAL